METIKGNIKQVIFKGDTGFFVGLFRVKEASNELKELVHKTVTISGLMIDSNTEEIYELKGRYMKHERYGYQFQFDSYDKIVPEGRDAVIEFLASPLIKGCGMKTAEHIVDSLGEDTLKLIKENVSNLLMVSGMSEKKAMQIYESVLAYSKTDDILIHLKELGFSIPEATKIVKHYGDQTGTFLEENIYQFKDFVLFDKLDHIFLTNHDANDSQRLDACTLEVMDRMANRDGNIYYSLEEIQDALKESFKLFISSKDMKQILSHLEDEELVYQKDDKIFLMSYEIEEREIAHSLYRMMHMPHAKFKGIKTHLKDLEDKLGVTYNEDQKHAIMTALDSPISIISGGPGTGKTTIVNAITKLYIEMNHLSPLDSITSIALLAPTGRAAKKLALSASLPAMTIHRYLKWNKDTNEFGINEYNKNNHKLIIVDETSMIDIHLFHALLNGILETSQIVFVGDTFQLPSVGPGLLLNDLVDSKIFPYTSLEYIYRQSENSYIPILAKEIKEHQLQEGFTEKKDDYNFLVCSSRNIKEMLKQIIERSIEKGLRVDDVQVLVPMYKGENGIDQFNILLQKLFNPKSKNKKEYEYYDTLYREGDKVLQLVNNPDCNVYNGDIGYILSIKEKALPKKHLEIEIDFDGNYVTYTREDLINIKHAYAMTIHKSQGSEFAHVIMPITKNYYKMLYNKLLYTGVSRAKKSLVILGETEAFLMAVSNDYSSNRKTDLKNKLMTLFEKEDL